MNIFLNVQLELKRPFVKYRLFKNENVNRNRKSITIVGESSLSIVIFKTLCNYLVRVLIKYAIKWIE